MVILNVNSDSCARLLRGSSGGEMLGCGGLHACKLEMRIPALQAEIDARRRRINAEGRSHVESSVHIWIQKGGMNM